MAARKAVERTYDDLGRQRAFGERLRALRADSAMTQEQLAEAAGMDRSNIADIERGARNCSIDTAFRIADALGIDPGELFRGL